MKRQKRIGREQRVFLEADLAEGVAVMCNAAQRNYLINVLRLDDGAPILVFNGRDGEWRARLRPQGKKVCGLEVTEQVRQQDAGPDLSLFFAPLKKARLDYMVQKATELGVAAIHPVFTNLGALCSFRTNLSTSAGLCWKFMPTTWLAMASMSPSPGAIASISLLVRAGRLSVCQRQRFRRVAKERW